jgi:hypothetical protein
MNKTYNIIFCICFCLFFSVIDANAQQEREYPFLVADAPTRLYTMRQSNENFMSAYRLGVRVSYDFLPDTIWKKPKIQKWALLYWAELMTSSLFFLPLTHEEGHRSILTAEGIGSISIPYFNRHLAAYVTGVRDAELQHLRDTKLPTYIRLHIAGNESDYVNGLRFNTLFSWGKESMRLFWADYFMRKVSVVAYYGMVLAGGAAGDLKEEANELDRDIVGDDVLGAIRHLHRPGMAFHRYTQFDELTDEEVLFSKRVGWRSLINLIDPVLIMKNGFTFSNDTKLNFAGGYGMAPFGDFIDEHFWLKAGKINAHIYLREFQNRNTWFPAAGVEFGYIPITPWLVSDVAIHGWQQPQHLDFNTTKGNWGGAIDAMFRFKLPAFAKKENMSLSLNLGINAKTHGYLLEEMALDSHVGLRFGASIWLK